MRSIWWLLKLLARATTRARRWLERRRVPGIAWEMGGPTPAPRPSLRNYLEALEPAERADLEQLATRWRSTFCGKCGADPDHPELRCDRCNALLESFVAANGDRVVEALGPRRKGPSA